MLKLTVDGPPSALASCSAARRVQLTGVEFARHSPLIPVSPLSAIEVTV
jgi:hypothetical protein